MKFIQNRKLHTMDKTIQDLEDRLWDMYDEYSYSFHVLSWKIRR